jgi:hypothetical protein
VVHVLAEGLTLFLLDHGQVHASTRSAHGACEVAGELLLQLVPLVKRVFVQRLEPCEWSLVQAEGEVEALGVVVAASVLDGEGVAPEPLDGSCFASYLVIPKGLNLSGRSKLRSQGEKAGKPSLSPAVVDFFHRSSSIL